MPIHRFPILVWEDFQGGHTAALADDGEGTAAFGATAGEAVDQLKAYLEWRYKQEPWRAGSDLLDPMLVHVSVAVRPEYRPEPEASAPPGRQSRTYACNEDITLRVACVCGRDGSGLLACSMPLLGARFTYYDPDSFKGLVAHYVQSLLRGFTPMEIARFLPPKSVALHEVVVRVPRKEARQKWEPKLEALSAVAEPLGVRGVRRQFSRPWERDAEVARLVDTLAREKSNVLLVGDGGTGKTAVAAEAVRKVERGKTGLPSQPDRPNDAEAQSDGTPPVRHRFWQTSAARLVAGMQYLGQWQERCERVIEELTEIGGVLCVENLLDLVRVGGVGPGDSLAAFLVPYLQRGDLHMVGEATAAELDACRRLLPGLAELFQVLTIPTFTRPQAVAALSAVAATHRQNLQVEVEPGVAEQVYRLFARFMPHQPFPGPAVAFLGQLFDRASRTRGPGVGIAGSEPGPPAGPRVTGREVIEQFVYQTGLPELFLRDEVPLSRETILAALREQVVGQESACRVAADVVTAFKAGLNDPNRPLGVLLFCGPTGVGKTELAKALSRYLFGHGREKDRLIRLDMSEYAGPGAAERLLGSAGVGRARGQPSPLVRRVRQQPFAVLLLDEIEKAAPEVFDLLLGVFDEGRLTDPYGRLTTFRSTVIVMTSNLGADRPGGFGLGRPAPPSYDAEAMAFFRPEFFNRLDAVVTFDSLTPDTMVRITEKELREIAAREGLTRAGLRLTWTERLVRRLADRGFDCRYGARPLQRVLETLLVARLSKHLMDHPNLRNARIDLDVNEADDILVQTN